MCGTDLQPRELVKGAIEDQARQEIRRLERIADDVAQIASPAQRIVSQDVVSATRMHHHRNTELGGLGPERIVFRQGEILAVYVAADGGAAQTETFDAVLQLLRRQI